MNIKLILLIKLIVSPFAIAQIQWESQKITQNSNPFSEPLLYTFSGELTAGKTSDVLSVVANCPCVKLLEVPEGAVDSSEAIQILAVLTPDDLSGNQKQYIKVSYKDPALKPDILVVECLMPAVVTANPQQLFWKTGSEKSMQSVKIDLNSNYAIQLNEVYVMDENFSSVLKNEQDDGFLVSVTPQNTAITRPAPLILKFMINGRSYKKIVPIVINQENPFDVKYRHKPSNRPQPIDLKRMSEEFKHQSKLKTSGSLELDETLKKNEN